MVKAIIVEKKKLKITAKEHENWLKQTKIGAMLLKEQDKQVKETLKELRKLKKKMEEAK